jgi:hypothetical protein
VCKIEWIIYKNWYNKLTVEQILKKDGNQYWNNILILRAIWQNHDSKLLWRDKKRQHIHISKISKNQLIN